MQLHMRRAFPDERDRPRFERHIHHAESGCHEWTGYVTVQGYATFSFSGRSYMAHVFSWWLNRGELVQKPLEIDHLCRNRRCVNPDHLEPVTRSQNVRRGLRSSLTPFCPQGHAYTPENTRLTKAGHRCCKQCDHLNSKKRWANGYLKEHQRQRRARNKLLGIPRPDSVEGRRLRGLQV
jgi:hypothetical protein